MIDNDLIFMVDCLDAICNDLQVRQLTSEDPELLRVVDAVYQKVSYAYQRLNNFIIIHKEDKKNNV